MKNNYKTIIIGAGPAGLSAGITLSQNKQKVLILEKDSQVGGISKTINYKGNRFDLGGHRFYTKIEEVSNLWNKTLNEDFLTRSRLSRIYYNNKFFFYPLKPSNALSKLGFFTSVKVIGSYIKIRLFPYKQENTFNEWVSNRFGKKLFKIFFKTYTEKLWGLPCNQIRADWATERIGDLSLLQAIKNSISSNNSKKIKTLITQFKYPKYGPGMMYKKMADNISFLGGKINLEQEVTKIYWNNNKIESLEIKDKYGNKKNLIINELISSMPITELIRKMDPKPPQNILEAEKYLKYRSFVVINIILDQKECFPDNWIYIHSPEVKLGRIQNFKNWSPYMVKNQNETTLGLEYFCNENDKFWKTDDKKLIEIGLSELDKIKLQDKEKFIDGFVIRVPKAYPVYNKNYKKNLEKIKLFLNKFYNLQLIGRSGKFQYNNMDKSVLDGINSAKKILNKN